MRTIEKASGRRAGSAASGIRERKGEGGILISPFFPTRPHSSPARFFIPPLTESLEQASNQNVLKKMLNSCQKNNQSRRHYTFDLSCANFLQRQENFFGSKHYGIEIL